MVALIRLSSSSSPRMASWRWRGVIRFTLRSLLALPANSSTCNHHHHHHHWHYQPTQAPAIIIIIIITGITSQLEHLQSSLDFIAMQVLNKTSGPLNHHQDPLQTNFGRVPRTVLKKSAKLNCLSSTTWAKNCCMNITQYSKTLTDSDKMYTQLQCTRFRSPNEFPVLYWLDITYAVIICTVYAIFCQEFTNCLAYNLLLALLAYSHSPCVHLLLCSWL